MSDHKVIKVNIAFPDADPDAVARLFLKSLEEHIRKQEQAEVERAIHRLKQDAPIGFFARLRWLWRLLRALW